MTTTEMLLRRMQHLRVIPEREGDRGSLDIRDLVDGVSCTIGYARNAECADSLNRTFEIAREVLAMPAELRELETQVERLSIAPGEILVIKSVTKLPPDAVAMVAKGLKCILPNTRVILLDAGISLEVITAEQIAETITNFYKAAGKVTA